MREDPLGLAGGDINTLRYAGNAATMYSDPSGLSDPAYVQEWHHLYPQEVFKDMKIPGVDIHAAENGLMLPARDHRLRVQPDGLGPGVHNLGWNKDWSDWVEVQRATGKPITAESMKAKLGEMMAPDSKYAGALESGKPATRTYSEQAEHLRDNAAKKAAKEAKPVEGAAAKKLGKEMAECAAESTAKKGARRVVAALKLAKKVPGVGAIASLLLWPLDMQAKGVAAGTVNSGLDAVPFLGTAKGVVELGTGDLIPDAGQPRSSAAETFQRAAEYLPRKILGDVHVNEHQQRFQSGMERIRSWFGQ